MVLPSHETAGRRTSGPLPSPHVVRSMAVSAPPSVTSPAAVSDAAATCKLAPPGEHVEVLRPVRRGGVEAG